MRQVLVIVFAGLLALPGFAQETGAAAEAVTEPAPDPAPEAGTTVLEPAFAALDAAEVTLEEFLWLKRPIVVFADTPADPRFKEQVSLLLERPADLLERDVVLIVDADPAAMTAIRKKLRPRGFMLTLVGKDGGVKLRKPFPWNVREIARAIDKWPLRIEEIRAAKAVAAE